MFPRSSNLSFSPKDSHPNNLSYFSLSPVSLVVFFSDFLILLGVCLAIGDGATTTAVATTRHYVTGFLCFIQALL
jgi:hypothetical protein